MTDSMARQSPVIHREMSILDIVSRWESTQAVFKAWDLAAGECICCNALFETLGDAAVKYNLDLDRLLRELEAAATESIG